MLDEHQSDLMRGKSVARLDVSTSISNAEQRLTVVEPAVRPRRMSITDLFSRPELAADGTGHAFKAQFVDPADLNSPREDILGKNVVAKLKARRASLDRGSRNGEAAIPVPAGARRERRVSLDVASFGQSAALRP